jgi:hypothetical protein
MNRFQQGVGRSLWVGIGVAAILVAGCTSVSRPGGTRVTLNGNQEVPSVSTAANGRGMITVDADQSIKGSVSTNGIAATAAHIHMAASGQNGPVIITLTKTPDGIWWLPAGAKLTNEQYDAFKAGKLYVNVHSDAYKGGEIRGQLTP